ncbi:MAG: transcriptional repressor [Candidatus Bathyarchaeota archaeon]
MSKIWKPIPLQHKIIEILNASNGSCEDGELLRILKKEGWEVSVSSLNKVLLQLEIQGYITVYTVGKGKRKVELKKT